MTSQLLVLGQVYSMKYEFHYGEGTKSNKKATGYLYSFILQLHVLYLTRSVSFVVYVIHYWVRLVIDFSPPAALQHFLILWHLTNGEGISINTRLISLHPVTKACDAFNMGSYLHFLMPN